jgi:hypothetical protein
MQPSRTTWGSEGSFGHWRYRYDWRYGLVGLALGLAIIVLAMRGHWLDAGLPLGTIVAGSSGFIWRRAKPGETGRDGDGHDTR